jgi:hypothetical protein
MKKLTEAEGLDFNKKRAQDLIKQLLIEHSLLDLDEIRRTEYESLSALSFGIVQTICESAKKGNFGEIRQLLDYAFEKDITRKR